MNRESFARAVKDYRAMAAVTQSEFAAELKVSVTLIRLIESQKWEGTLSRSPAASKIARYIGLDSESLAGGWVNPHLFEAARKESGIGPTQLAKSIGRSRQYVECLRRNTRYSRVSAPGFIEACKILGRDPEEFEE